MHPAWKVALAATVLGLLGPTAAAQALDPVVGVEADADRVVVAHDASRAVTWTVRNDGPLQVTIALDLALDGPWTSDFGDRYGGPFPLASGAARSLTVRLSPGTDTTEAVPDGGALLTAQATDGAGRTAGGSADVVLAYVPAPVPPVAPPDHTLRNALLGAGAGLLLLAALYEALGRSVALRPAHARVDMQSLRGAWVRVEVVNRMPWRRSVRVRLRNSPGVVATTDTDLVRVPARGRAPLTLFVRSIEGAGRVRVDARTRGQRWRRRASVRVGPAVPVPSPFAAPEAEPEPSPVAQG